MDWVIVNDIILLLCLDMTETQHATKELTIFDIIYKFDMNQTQLYDLIIHNLVNKMSQIIHNLNLICEHKLQLLI